MDYEEMERRRRELRNDDPHGRLSNSDIERIVMREDVERRIDNMPDITDQACDLKRLLRDMLELIV